MLVSLQDNTASGGTEGGTDKDGSSDTGWVERALGNRVNGNTSSLSSNLHTRKDRFLVGPRVPGSL